MIRLDRGDDEWVQMKAELPKKVKRLLFSQLALQELSFTAWVYQRAVAWLKEQEGEQDR